MTVGLADWMVVGFFLVALILIRRFQHQIRAESLEGYRRAAGGLSFLSLAALSRLYFGLGWFEGVPFVSETLFFDLAYWIVVIAGGALLVTGVAEWLPLARSRRRYSADRIARLELLRRVEQLVGVENRLDNVLANTLHYMREAMSLTSGAVFKLSAAGDRLTMVASTSGFPVEPHLLEQTIRLRMRDHWGERSPAAVGRRLLEVLPPELDRPILSLPIEVRQHSVGFFVFWDKAGREIDTDDRLILRLAVDVIARKIDMDRLVIHNRSNLDRQLWFEQMDATVAEAADTRQRFVALARGLARQASFDTLAVTVMTPDSRGLVRYTYGTSGQVLVEKGRSPVSPEAVTAPAFHSGQTVVHHDLTPDRQPTRDEIITPGAVRSILAVPIPIGDHGRIVVTLAAERRGAFGSTVQALIRRLRPIIVSVVLPDIVEATSRRDLRRLEKLTRLVQMSAEPEPEKAVLQAVACLAAEESGADLVRIALLDESGKFLESKALAATVPLQGMIPADGQMILSLMPLHERALQTGQPQFVGSAPGSSALTDIEARQAFTEGVGAAAIVPLVNAGESTGVISMAGLKPDSSLVVDSRMQLFAEALAAAAALKMTSFEAGERRLPNRLSPVRGTTDGHRWTPDLITVSERAQVDV